MTTITNQMMKTHPDLKSLDTNLLTKCIDACMECSEACTACADACMSEEMIAELTKCIRLNLDCADISATTARVLLRQTDVEPAVMRSMLEACIQACRSCGEECRQHSEHMEHCRVCADACQRCEAACEELMASL
jgi:hypothetical protein